jgi:anthranilate synthase component 1
MEKTAAPTLIPVVRELPADLETPISAYLKLAGRGPSFLLESVTGGQHLARYSFLGVDLREAFILRADQWERHTPRGVASLPLREGQTPLGALRGQLGAIPDPKIPGLPRLCGGLVGYLGFESVRYIEPSLPLAPHPELPEAIFLLADTLIAFDHAYGKMLLIAMAPSQAEVPAAEARLDDLAARLEGPLPEGALPEGRGPDPGPPPGELRSNLSFERFCQGVRRAKEHIAAGDIYQVVLSQRLSRRTSARPLAIYRALRRINPSPYMFYFDFSDLAGDEPLQLIGASPEMHVRLEDGVASLRPIAGTRPRGRTPQEDRELADDLLADPKERAEHVMLVDLGRNDLGRVCEYGSVQVREQMVIEHYSHVMHIVSHVEGKLRPGLDAIDLLEATFPAGTVSGAPKVRAMEIIHGLEKGARGPYAGAVGYLSFDGSCDTCIAIRTLVMRGQQVSVQAGCGIVADSDPASEYQESLNKARALFAAVEAAENPSPEGSGTPNGKDRAALGSGQEARP